ncbi:hypothetical protein LL912_03800 [Niabella sp. CC-SYL272]|uniref:DUF6660 family protein n=1 Tax=Niabella agricola TaxID=2891571 RepID=UPI001F1607CD|nr:DUF6660 family protein [Niabella agricola]MCF3107894.1 hypothetical protein [Niabella agricola]
MKWFLFLFGFYLLSLTAVPCSDDGDACTGSDAGITLQTASNHTHTTEHCTPLCLCNCCSSVVAKIPLAPAVNPGALMPAGFKTALYADQYLAGFKVPVWQPPKPLC